MKPDVWSMAALMNAGMDHAEVGWTDSSRNCLNLDWHAQLDQAGRYGLDWSVDYAANQILFSIYMNRMSSNFRQGSDVFALGFSAYGLFESSDFCIIWYDLSRQIHLQDARTDPENRLQLVDESRSVCELVKSELAQNLRTNRSGLRSKVEIGGEVQDNYDEVSSEGDTTHESLMPCYEKDSFRIAFKRPLDVCSSDSYYTIDNGTTHLVWFKIKGPLLSLDGLNLTDLMGASEAKNHNHRLSDDDQQFEFGMKRVQLIAKRVPKSTTRSSTHDIRVEAFNIPAKETTYWCKLFKLPHKFESRKFHITKYEAVIGQGNDHIVHHMELFNCANLDPLQTKELHDLYENGGWAGECSGQSRPRASDPCKRVIMAWAMGAQPLEYPQQVGQLIGGRGYSPYVVLEIHYNNVGLEPGLVDNSGLRFHYTSKLRPFDAGILEVGLEYTDKNSIPPNLITPIAGHCVGECLRAAMSSSRQASSELEWAAGRAKTGQDLEEGIYVFAGQMHTHLAGVASWTEHVRGGQLLGEIQRDSHYSPHFQEIRLLSEPVHIAPGDALIHYCLYDTRSRSNITLGGFATSDEMCVTYLHYYPRIDLEVCKSSVDTQYLESYFAYLARDEGQSTSERLPGTRKGEQDSGRVMSVSENYKSIHWTPKRGRELIQFYRNAPLSVQCNRSDGSRYPGHWNGIAPSYLWAEVMGGKPYEVNLPSARQLVEYRGHGYGRRHAQCHQGSGSGNLGALIR